MSRVTERRTYVDTESELASVVVVVDLVGREGLVPVVAKVHHVVLRAASIEQL